MHRHLTTIFSAALLCAFALAWAGCDKQEEPPPPTPPLVVRKAIAPEKPPRPAGGATTPGTKPAPGAASPAPNSTLKPPAAPEKKAPGDSTASGPETADVKTAVHAAVPGTSPALPPEPEVSKAEYDPMGRVDPFAPLFKPPPTEETAVITPHKKTKKRRALTPLEKLDLSQIKLVGVLRVASESKALVEESSGKGYVVTKGMYMGRNSGIVTEILKDRVVIEEEIEGFTGKISIEKRELKMEKPVGDF